MNGSGTFETTGSAAGAGPPAFRSVVALLGSRNGAQVLVRASELAAAAGVPLRVRHPRRMADAQRVESLLASLRAAGMSVESEVQERAADLTRGIESSDLVVKERGHGRKEQRAILTESGASLLLVPRAKATPIRNILVALGNLDDPLAEKAGRTAVRSGAVLAKLTGARLSIATSWQIPPTGWLLLTMSPVEIEKYAAAEAEDARRGVERFLEREGIHVAPEDIHAARGSANAAIARVARKTSAGVVVAARRRGGRLRRALSGYDPSTILPLVKGAVLVTPA